MTKTEIVLVSVAFYLFFRLLKEFAYIKLYSFILKLQSEGKLTAGSDPNGIAEKTKNDLIKNSTRWI
ncbi:MAG: hypothetical protein ACK504_04275 [Bacteroidota bacterium]|jgi:hypothetical protein